MVSDTRAETIAESAEAVRDAVRRDRKLRRLRAKVAAGHENLRPMLDRLESADAAARVPSPGVEPQARRQRSAGLRSSQASLAPDRPHGGHGLQSITRARKEGDQ